MLPFTREQFLAVFVAYNEAVWPAQVVAYLLTLWMVIFIIWPLQQRSRVVAAELAAMWLWTGVACSFGLRSTVKRPLPNSRTASLGVQEHWRGAFGRKKCVQIFYPPLRFHPTCWEPVRISIATGPTRPWPKSSAR